MCAICNGRTYGGGFCAGPEAQPDDGWLDVFIVRKVGRLTIAKLLSMYKSGKHFQNGQLVRAAEPYFIYRRAKQVSLRAADGRGPIVATADGECAPKEQITVQVQPLAGRIFCQSLLLSALQRRGRHRVQTEHEKPEEETAFLSKKKAVSFSLYG